MIRAIASRIGLGLARHARSFADKIELHTLASCGVEQDGEDDPDLPAPFQAPISEEAEAMIAKPVVKVSVVDAPLQGSIEERLAKARSL